MKYAYLVCIVLLFCLVFPVKSDGAVSHTFEVQGAKIVSEGGYFWFEVLGLGSQESLGHYSVQFSKHFTFRGFHNNENMLNISQASVPADSELIECVNFTLQNHSEGTLLFIAPFLQTVAGQESNETSITLGFIFSRLDTGDEIRFWVQVLSLTQYDPSINPLYYSLRREIDFLNMKLGIILNRTGFDWNKYCNSPFYNFTQEFTNIHDLIPEDHFDTLCTILFICTLFVFGVATGVTITYYACRFNKLRRQEEVKKR